MSIGKKNNIKIIPKNGVFEKHGCQNLVAMVRSMLTCTFGQI